ncbi:MAG: hypothetical protein A3K10_13380 [Bacteroidetes bacterium RIFCSPLOWO2_12_FULL_31_6]|nr:MAG: hypothetical protein A3K10_13380 [Bacteroidetes bacterium RIFCSPLOWO2_12_FULL_31_6]
MKTLKLILLTVSISLVSNIIAQPDKPNCAVLNINLVGVNNYSPEVAGNITRREFSKLGIYEILYAQDIKPLLNSDTQENIKSFDCYSKQCLVAAGKKIGSEKMLSGQIEQMRDAIIISFRIINVNTNTVEYSSTKEFLNLDDQLKNMIIITLREMMGLENDVELENLLIKKFSRESYINNKGINRLNLSGTRMGVVTMLGSNKEIIKSPESEGGFDGVPIFFNFGYQFESQYLNQGRVQGLFEFIPSITGLEQGLVMPSITILHGIRDNKTGFEFAFGPTFGMAPIISGYYDDTKKWHLESEWDTQQYNPNDTSFQEIIHNPYSIINQLDSRGKNQLTTGFLIGMGFSIKSGEINIPINLYTVMQKKSLRAGISIGINAKKNRN